jgi:hypothetical protein
MPIASRRESYEPDRSGNTPVFQWLQIVQECNNVDDERIVIGILPLFFFLNLPLATGHEAGDPYFSAVRTR